MFNEEQIEFLKAQAQTKEGQKWIETIKAIANSLYYSKGISAEDIRPRQIAAELLEKLVATAETEDKKPRQGNEYI